MQAGLLVQVSKVGNAYTVAQRNDMAIAPFHGSRQIIEMIRDVVRLIVCDFSLVDPTRIDGQMLIIWEKENYLLLEILKYLFDIRL